MLYHYGAGMHKDNITKEVVILLTDMEQYSRLTQHMRPGEIRDYIIAYYQEFRSVLLVDEFQPVSIDPSAGDGAVIVFEKRAQGSVEELCTRALQAAIRCNMAIDEGRI
ncbi:MAG TPA: hypothetical protein VJ969_02175, partial [Desulfopila sp.]|nr:hypothetical protein [Desulfopila sp.]